MSEKKITNIEQQREEMVSQSINQLPIVSEILEILDKKLPKNIYYHAKSHTDDVLGEVVLFALVDGLSLQDMRLLAIAAAFHDAGFIKSPVDNEKIGAEMAVQAMTKSGDFSHDDINKVAQMILDTRLVETKNGLKQVPTLDLSRYLLDADLSNFGREDFFEKGELQRRELGYDRELFLRNTYELISNHKWLTNAAFQLRQAQKAENVQLLKKMIENQEGKQSNVETGIERLVFLSKLPLLLNSSLQTRRVVEVSLEHLRTRVGAEAATVFLKDDASQELTFWALQGGDGQRLEGLKMPADRGIVGSVIKSQQSALIDDVSKDKRFFNVIDKEGKGFTTRTMICVPLIVRGSVTIGALQVINKIDNQKFSDDDLLFVEQFASQVALAIDNSRLHETLLERNKKLEVLDRRKNEMTHVIAHEFRTPLNIIRLTSEMLASKGCNDEKTVTEMSAALGRGVDRLIKLIEQVKNLSLITEKKLDLQLDKLSLSDLIHQAARQFSDSALARRIKLDVNVPDNVHVEADKALILIVLGNLISNGIRFTPDEGTVSINLDLNAGFARVAIKDNGIGIDKENINLVFEKFYEVSNYLSHSSGNLEFKSGGLGLGLATAQSIISAHGSRVEVVSEPGKGSEFYFHLRLI